MELEAIVSQILPMQSGTSARGNWSSQDVIFEIPAEFNNKICVTFRNDKMSEITSLNINDKVKVHFNISSREWNSRWYTSLNGWRVEKAVVAPSQNDFVAPVAEAQPPLESYSSDSESASGNDLPF
ncbi:MAG: DUF3127 domain-containing protein [Rikenellaceae bacterium]